MNAQEIAKAIANKQMMDRAYARLEKTCSEDGALRELIRETHKELAHARKELAADL